MDGELFEEILLTFTEKILEFQFEVHNEEIFI